MTHTERANKNAATRVTLIGAFLDLFLGVIKLVVGILGNSLALISDGIHSLSDVVTDAFVLVISRVSHAKPDRSHPYGHRRFETLGTIALGIVLFAIAAVICFDSIRRLYQVDPLPVPGWFGLVVAAISIASKEWIYRYTRRVADKVGSSLLLANAWHSRTDALSSIAVFIGITGALLGFPVMDLLAAMAVAAIIGWIAYGLVADSLRELVDTALPRDEVAALHNHVKSLEGILDAHAVRTRRHGGKTLVDLHVQVAPHISVSEGHYLAEHAGASLRQAFPDISDIVIHIDPESDNRAPSNTALPLRQEIHDTLMAHWRAELPNSAFKRLELHYLENQVEADVYIDIANINNELKENLEDSVKHLPWLGRLTFYASL